MSREHEMQQDIDILRLKLKEDYDSIVLPKNLDTENMLKQIEDMPQDKVIRPNFRRSMSAAVIALLFITVFSFLALPNMIFNREKPSAAPEAQEFVAESISADLTPKEKAAGLEEEKDDAGYKEFFIQGNSQDALSFPACVLQKEPVIPDTGEFTVMELFPREGITTIEIGSSFNGATAVYSTPEEVGSIIEIMDGIKITKSDNAMSGNNGSVTAVFVYEDGSFFEISINNPEVIINLQSSNLVIANPEEDAAARLVNKYKKDTGI